MLIINKNDFDIFNFHYKEDLEKRFIFYLFDLYPFLKKSFSYENLYSLFENKKKEFNENVFIMMEAEIIFGEFYIQDIYFENLIKSIFGLEDFYDLLSGLIEDFKLNVLSRFGDDILKIYELKNEKDISLYVELKKDFLNEFDGLDTESDVLNFVLGSNYKKNVYLKNLVV